MLFQQYKGPFNSVARTEGKFQPFSEFPSRQQQNRELLNILLLLSMRFVDKPSAANARADLLSTLPVQQQDPSRAVLSLLPQSAAAKQAESSLTLSGSPSISASRLLLRRPLPCQLQQDQRTRTWLLHTSAASQHQDSSTGGRASCLASVIEEGQTKRLIFS